MSKCIKIVGGGNDCRVVIVREIPVAVGEVDRRVLGLMVNIYLWRSAHGVFWFQSAVCMVLKVASENRLVRRKSKESYEKERHD